MPLQETILLLDEPAAAAISAASVFLRHRGVLITHQTEYSVAFAVASDQPGRISDVGPGPRTHGGPGPAGDDGPGPTARTASLAPREQSAGQVAAVPVQLRPAWCRVWVTVNGHGAVAAADAYVATQRERSARVAVAVQELERGIYDESRWPAYEATLRSTLQRQGIAGAALDEKLLAWKKRWMALGRKAAAGPEDG